MSLISSSNGQIFQQTRLGRIHSFYPPAREGVNAFQQFCGRQGIFLEKGLDGKDVVNFWRGLRGFQRQLLNFTSRLLFDLLFTSRLKDVASPVFFTYFFSLFRFTKSFLTVIYFSNSLFKRKNVQKLTQMSYFSFSFKLNEQRKVPLKKHGLKRGGYKKTFA